MATTRIHADKTPIRIHYIVEWSEKTGKGRADIIEATGADKSLVSRWFSGTVPKERYLVQLAALFELDDEISALFRHPDDDWISRFYRNRSAAEREKMLKAMLDSVGLAASSTEVLRLRRGDGTQDFEGPGEDLSQPTKRAIEGGKKR